MQRAVVAALLLAVPLCAAAAEPPQGRDVTFSPPAQAGPGLGVADATWALLVFRDGGAGGFDVRFPAGARHENLTFHRLRASGSVVADPPLDPLPSPAQPVPPLQAAARVAGAGSLYLEGDSISVEAADAPAEAVPGGCVRGLLADADQAGREARYNDLCPGDGVALVARGAPAASVRIAAHGLRVVEWHHLDVRCPERPDRCPDGGVRRSRSAGPPGQQVEAQELGYHRFTASGAAVEGAASPALLLLGGGRLDVAVHGSVRLPAALDGRTLQADGDLALRGLRPAEDGRLRARLDGAADGARLDEAGVDPASLGLGAAGAVAAAGLLGLLAKAAAALFSRLTPERSLRHPLRQRLLDAVRAHPGIHERALARLAGEAPGTVRHHVGVLVRQGLATRVRDGRVVRLRDARPDALRAGDPAAALLLEPALGRLDGWRREHPGATPADAVRHAVEAWGWSRSTAYHRLARLDGSLARS
jgi:DNA-binding transcriptional ArsR family regulator